MRRGRRTIGIACALVTLAAGLAATAQALGGVEPVRLLVIDETKTFLSTMRVAGLVGALKGAGLFAVDVRFATVEKSWTDPLAGEAPDADSVPYDVVLVIPRGIDDGTADWVWILSDGPSDLGPLAAGGIEMIREVVGLVFEGAVRPTGVHDDLLLGLLYEIYVAKGWMR